jgi:hypothetical protein
MNAALLGWLIVISVLSFLGIRSCLYFRREYKGIGNNNWVLAAIYSTVLLITVACVGLALLTISSAVFGPTIVGRIVGAILILLLLLIPYFLHRIFKNHEGKL